MLAPLSEISVPLVCRIQGLPGVSYGLIEECYGFWFATLFGQDLMLHVSNIHQICHRPGTFGMPIWYQGESVDEYECSGVPRGRISSDLHQSRVPSADHVPQVGLEADVTVIQDVYGLAPALRRL